MTASIAIKSDFSTLTSEEEFEAQKYDSIAFNYRDNFEYQSMIFKTEAGNSSIKQTSMPDMSRMEVSLSVPEPRRDSILSEVEGVIDMLNEKTVRVKLFPKTYVNFPYILFKDHEKVRQGQHIKYLIKKDKEGYRYQEIETFQPEKQHPEKELVLKLLDEFKYRNE